MLKTSFRFWTYPSRASFIQRTPRVHCSRASTILRFRAPPQQAYSTVTRGERQCQSITSEQQHVRVKNITSLLNIIDKKKKRYKQHRTMRRYHTDTNTDTKSCILPLHSHPQPAKCSSHSTKQYPKSLKLERCIYFSTCPAMSTDVCVWLPDSGVLRCHTTVITTYCPWYLVKRTELTSVWANVLYKSHY